MNSAIGSPSSRFLPWPSLWGLAIAAVAMLCYGVLAWIRSTQDVTTGKKLQAGADAQAQVATVTAEAQAEAQAPNALSGVIQAAQDDKF